VLLILALLAAAPQTQRDMTQEAGTAYAGADAGMSRQWTATYAHMKGIDARDRTRGGGFGYAAALLASQRAWLKFRDAQCVIEGGEYAGGSAQSMVATQCRTKLTTARTQQLKSLIWNH
jgi:uncharacterized protein YecT (DUF1311 family)